MKVYESYANKRSGEVIARELKLLCRATDDAMDMRYAKLASRIERLERRLENDREGVAAV